MQLLLKRELKHSWKNFRIENTVVIENTVEDLWPKKLQNWKSCWMWYLTMEVFLWKHNWQEQWNRMNKCSEGEAARGMALSCEWLTEQSRIVLPMAQPGSTWGRRTPTEGLRCQTSPLLGVVKVSRTKVLPQNFLLPRHLPWVPVLSSSLCSWWQPSVPPMGWCGALDPQRGERGTQGCSLSLTKESSGNKNLSEKKKIYSNIGVTQCWLFNRHWRACLFIITIPFYGNIMCCHEWKCLLSCSQQLA